MMVVEGNNMIRKVFIFITVFVVQAHSSTILTEFHAIVQEDLIQLEKLVETEKKANEELEQIFVKHTSTWMNEKTNYQLFMRVESGESTTMNGTLLSKLADSINSYEDQIDRLLFEIQLKFINAKKKNKFINYILDQNYLNWVQNARRLASDVVDLYSMEWGNEITQLKNYYNENTEHILSDLTENQKMINKTGSYIVNQLKNLYKNLNGEDAIKSEDPGDVKVVHETIQESVQEETVERVQQETVQGTVQQVHDGAVHEEVVQYNNEVAEGTHSVETDEIYKSSKVLPSDEYRDQSSLYEKPLVLALR